MAVPRCCCLRPLPAAAMVGSTRCRQKEDLSEKGWSSSVTATPRNPLIHTKEKGIGTELLAPPTQERALLQIFFLSVRLGSRIATEFSLLTDQHKR